MATRSSPIRGRPTILASARRRQRSGRSSTRSSGRSRPARWSEEVTPGWTLKDHVGHLADWATEGVRAIEVFHASGTWLADPDEGIDAWNERHVVAARGESPAAVLARYDEASAAMLAAVETLSIEDLRSPDGWSWAQDCLHGHVRKHLAMLGRWCAVADWPGA